MNKYILLFGIILAAFLNTEGKDYNYFDASSFTVTNKAQSDAPVYSRLNVDKYPDLNAKLRRFFRHSTGIGLRFRTDSPSIRAIWTVPDTEHLTNAPAIATKGLDLYIRDEKSGKWLWAGYGSPEYVGKEGNRTLVDNMEWGMKECLLYLPVFQSLDSLRIGIEKGYVIESDGGFVRAPIVAMGSSFTHGNSVSRPGMAWPQQLSRMIGIDVANLGTSGVCKLEPVLADIIADTDADMFIFDTFSNPTAQEVRERFVPFVKRIREKHPETPLVFLKTFHRENTNFDLKKRKVEEDRTAAAEEELAKVMKTDRNIYYFSPGLYSGDDHETTCDGTHPSDLGYHRAAENISKKLKPLLKKYKIKQD